MANDSIKISIELADAAAQKALTSFISNSNKADSSVKKLGDSGKNVFNNLAVSIGKTLNVYDIFAGNLAANIAGKALDGIKNSIHNLIAEAAASEQAIKNLEVALSSAGLNTNGASEGFQKLAGAIQETTSFSDEAVLASSTLLLNLTSLSKDGIEEATRAAVDLAATLNIDLSTATEMIAKAVNGNTTAFKKQGIEIQSATSDSARLTNVLAALENQQGKAAQQSNTYAGAQAKLANQQSELSESLGKLFTQSKLVVDVTSLMSNMFSGVANFITRNTDIIRDLGQTLLVTTGIIVAGAAAYAAASTALGILGVMAVTGTSAFGALGIAATAAWTAITGPIGLIVIGVTALAGVVYALIRNWDEVRIATYNALAAALEMASQVVGLVSGDLAGAIDRQAQSFRNQAGAIKEASEAAKQKALADAEAQKSEDQQAIIRQKRLEDARRESDLHNAYLISQDKISKEQLVLNESEYYLQLAELSAQNEEAKLARNGELGLSEMEAFRAQREQRLLEQQEYDRQELELQIQSQLAKAQAETDDRKRREALEEVDRKATASRQTLSYKQDLDRKKLQNTEQDKLDKEAIKNRTNTLNLFASLQDSNNSTMAAIGKAAALTQIAIATPVAVAEAYEFGTSTGGPVLGAVFGGIAAAAMAAQAAKVAGIAFEDGGIVPGNSYSGDRIGARVNSGEMVLNRQQQTELFKMANGSGNGVFSRSELVSAIREVVNTPIIVNVDGRELFNLTRDQLNSGRSY